MHKPAVFFVHRTRLNHRCYEKIFRPLVTDSFCAGLFLPKARCHCRTTTRSTKSGLGRPREGTGRTGKSINGPGEIGREAERSHSSPDSSRPTSAKYSP